ncbi:MAG: ankyrin repeat domain-containing protein [Deltaproteobacteria bacterium]|nr:ankyrin repeat domain-containing protein [Deltaproteobacteria bacterium]
MVKSLLEKGANPFLKNYERQTALWLARQKGDAQVVEIIEALSRTAKPEYKLEALGHSIMDGDMSMLQELLGTGVDLDAWIPSYGKPVLQLAVDRGRNEMAKFLIQRGAGVNIRDKFHRTPLMAASGWGDLELVKLLLDRGADPNARDNSGRTPLSIATKQGHNEVKALLGNHGATQ